MKKSLGAKTILYPTPVLIVGTYDNAGTPNGMAAAWGGICCSRPPCVSVSLRKATYSYGSIVARQAFTVSVPSKEHVVEADYFGIASGRDGDKIADSGLTPRPSRVVEAPGFEEARLILECEKTYWQDMDPEHFLDGAIAECYPEQDYHRIYYGKILSVEIAD